MISPTRTTVSLAAKYALALSLFAAVAGGAFAAWAAHGPDIFVAMIQSGMSWCF